MKRSLLTVGVVAAMLVASSAFAAGINLAWTNCVQDGGTSSRTFACTSNTGSNVMMGTFIEDTDHNNVSGAEIIMDLISQTSPLPTWWAMKEAGTCRQNALSIANYPDGAACFDWSAGQATPAIASYTIGFLGANTARIKAITAVPVSALANLTAGTEYGVFRMSISNAQTVGTACTGCLTNVCVVLNSVNLTTSGNLDNRFLGQGATSLTSNQITWQGAGADCQAVPARNATWGQVKSLYR